MENKKSFIINVLYFALIFGLVYLFCNYLLGIVFPFVLAFLFAYLAIIITRKLFKKDNKIFRTVSLILVYLIIVLLITLLVVLGVNEIVDFIGALPSLYKQYVEPVLTNLSNQTNGLNENLPIEIQSDLKEIISAILDSIKTIVSNFSSTIVSSATKLLSNTTNLIIDVMVVIIASFFFVYDYDLIINFFTSRMNDESKKIYDEITDFLVNTVWLVIRSYGLIMLLTFVELFIGLLILGIPNFALIAMMISFLDILPVLGVGTVLIPWGLFELVVGNYGLCIGIFVLYFIISFIRNIIEPKLVGGNLELHPLATLFTMLIGLELFGVIGMFGLPLLSSFLIKKENKEKLKQDIK